MVEHIPLSKLEEGFEKGTTHIQNMIDASKTLFDSKHYAMSISISILILEELTKFRVILTHLRKKKQITKEEWDVLSKGGSHDTKLTKLFEDAQDEVIQMGEEHQKRVQELSKKLGEGERSDFQILLLTLIEVYVQPFVIISDGVIKNFLLFCHKECCWRLGHSRTNYDCHGICDKYPKSEFCHPRPWEPQPHDEWSVRLHVHCT